MEIYEYTYTLVPQCEHCEENIFDCMCEHADSPTYPELAYDAMPRDMFDQFSNDVKGRG